MNCRTAPYLATLNNPYLTLNISKTVQNMDIVSM